MTISLYDATVATFLQIGTAMAANLDKGAAWATEQGTPLEDLTAARLHPDMGDLRFQVYCVAHHSLAAAQAFESGEFGPPSGYESYDYAGLQQLLADALDGLGKLERAAVDALAGGTVTFRLGKTELPFTTENFALCFSLPNFYFHATTAYDILRAQGVPVGKRDFLGAMRMGV